MPQTSLFTFGAITAAITTGVALWLAHAAWRQRPATGAVILTWLTLAVALWSSGKAIIAFTTDLAWCVLAAKYAMVGVVAAPSLLFAFVLVYTGFDRRLWQGGHTVRDLWPALWIMPLLTIAAALAYPWLRLQWADFQPLTRGCIAAAYGPWFYVHLFYTFTLLVLAALILSWYAFAVRGLYRQTALIVAVALLAPLPPAFSFAMKLPYGMPIDWTHLGLLISSSVLLIAVKRRDFLEVRPIAVDQLLEQMADAILVIDRQLRVVDCNRAALTDLGLVQAPLGQPLSAIMERLLGPDSPVESADRWSVTQLLEMFQQEGGSDGELVVMQPALRHYHWRLSPLGTRNDAPGAGWILVWRDMTQDRLKLAMLYEQERALALLAARQRQETELAQQMRTELERVRRLGQHALAALDQGDAAVGAAALAYLLTAIGHSTGPAAVPPPTGDRGDAADAATFLTALNAFLQEYARLTSAPVTFTCTDPAIPAMLSPWMLVQLVRILQEVLQGFRQTLPNQTLPNQTLAVSLVADATWVTLAVAADATPGDAPTPDDALSAWLANSSAPRRAAAVAGRIEVTPGPAPQVAISLPRALAQRLAQLQGRCVLIGSEVAQATALADVLHAQGMEIVSATTTKELVAQVRSVQPELILADIRILTPSPAVAVRRLRRSATETCTIILLAPTTADVEPDGAIRSGADGYLLTSLSSERFVAGLANLLAGDPPLAAAVAGELLAPTLPAEEAGRASEGLRLGLTDRQQEILTLIVRGFTYREIAAQLYISERTVRYDAFETRKRMGVARRSDMIEFAIEHDLVRGATGIESAVR